MTLPAQSWRAEAACRDVPKRVFYPTSELPENPEVIAAKAICWHCPVRYECRMWALDHQEFTGIWGSTTGEWRRVEHERRQRRNRRTEGAA